MEQKIFPSRQKLQELRRQGIFPFSYWFVRLSIVCTVLAALLNIKVDFSTWVRDVWMAGTWNTNGTPVTSGEFLRERIWVLMDHSKIFLLVPIVAAIGSVLITTVIQTWGRTRSPLQPLSIGFKLQSPLKSILVDFFLSFSLLMASALAAAYFFPLFARVIVINTSEIGTLFAKHGRMVIYISIGIAVVFALLSFISSKISFRFAHRMSPREMNRE